MIEPRKRTGQPTIADVAELAGVSRAIASRALSSEPRPVSADKRERVLQAARKLGYKPNLLARSLTTKTVNLVAVVVNHIHDLSDLDLFDHLISEIQSIGKQVIFVRVGSSQGIEEFLRNGIAYHVDAALVFSDFADAASVRKMFRNDSVLMLNGMRDDAAPAIIPDELAGIATAVADAAEKGVRTALLVTGRAASAVEQARVGHYRSELQRSGIALIGELRGDYSYESGRRIAASPEWKSADAVFCTSDAMAMGVLDVHREAILKIGPKAFLLYGFDDVTLAEYEAYPISSIGYDKTAYIKEILRFLTNTKAFRSGGTLVQIPTYFVSRESSRSK